MTDILVTKTAVRKLAAALSATDTRPLRHTDRLALIADAFGWKPDAFMHALKSAEKDSKDDQPHHPQNHVWDRTLRVTPSASKKLEAVMSHAASAGGIVIVSGCAGSGRTSTLSTLSAYAEDHGRPLVLDLHSHFDWKWSDLDSWKLESIEFAKRSRVAVMIEEARSKASLLFAEEIAKAGALVLISMIAPTSVATIRRLSDFKIGKDFMPLIRGVVSQQLVTRPSQQPNSNEPTASRKYRGRAPIMDVWLPGGPLSPPDGSGADYEAFEDDLLEAVELGIADEQNIEFHLSPESRLKAEARRKARFSQKSRH